MAIGEYYRFKPPQNGERFVAWRKLELPRLDEVVSVSNGLSVTRRFVTPEGEPVDMGGLRCGEMVISEISVESADERFLSDLVIEDLFAGAFEPVHGSLLRQSSDVNEVEDWVMRSDARDDRMLVFSKRFKIGRGERAVFRHPLRVVSSGDYTLPGVSVEAMYFPELNAQSAPARMSVHAR